ncbi:MAG: histidine ammonia-lyase [Bacteroidia bacterium]|nr:histidine ammonia-lyase [Bacteroidia bacterium]MDW8157813.1 histidine ammonia-lyase [Bacteroidia bacterium]
MPALYYLHPANHLTIDKLTDILNAQLALSTEAVQALEKSYLFLKECLEKNPNALYGINTGFGSLCNTIISDTELSTLQHNLLLSHACGTGEWVPLPIVKIMLLLKIQALIYGYSAVRKEVVERLITLYNANLLPVVYTQGSLGASGDLAPLAHLCLPLIGEGKIWSNGNLYSTAEIYAQMNLEPLQLEPKEGLALLNGTQFMLAYGYYILLHLNKLEKWADIIATLSLDAFACCQEPFAEALHRIRPHKGQQITAHRIRILRAASSIANAPSVHVQDPYSFRCIPQVHGAVKDALEWVSTIMQTEAASVSDNPSIFPEERQVLAGGNFHGQQLALALDTLAIAMTYLGSIAERRIYQLLSGTRNLPPFLSPKPGLNSGFMILQYTAAALVNQNQHLCYPSSVASIPSSNGQEDYVSMGANSATKAYTILENLKTILAIELMHASQALYFRLPQKTSPLLEAILDDFRQQVPIASTDRIFSHDITVAKKFLDTYEINHIF